MSDTVGLLGRRKQDFSPSAIDAFELVDCKAILRVAMFVTVHRLVVVPDIGLCVRVSVLP